VRLLLLLLTASLAGCMSADKAAAPSAAAAPETVQKEPPLPPPPSKGMAKTKRMRRRKMEVEDRDRDRRQAAVKPRKPVPPIRAGARRLTAFHGPRAVVPFRPDQDVTLARTARACGTGKLGAEMGAFAQIRRADRQRKVVDVERGADSVRSALARQLGAMGWELLQDGGLSPRPGAAKSEGLLARFAFKGEVAFFVEGAGGARKATVTGKVTVLDDRGREVHEGEVTASGESAAPRLTRRTELARRGALAAFVRRFFGDAKLDARLAGAVRRALRRERGR